MQPEEYPTIWSSIECDAFARGFDYENYLSLHKRAGCIGGALTKVSYEELYTALDNIFEREKGGYYDKP